MKKLNLNNSIATTAMLTKMNAMKNKMNLFAKVVMLVVMILTGEGMWNNVRGVEPVLYNGKWYSLCKNNERKSNENNQNFEDEVYPPTNKKLHFEYYNHTLAAVGSSYKVDIEAFEFTTQWSGSLWKETGLRKDADRKTANIPCSENVTKTSIKRTSNYFFNGNFTLCNLQIELAKHFYFDNNGSRAISMSKTDFSSSTINSECQPTPQTWTVYLNSFYIDNTASITISRTSGSSYFSVDTTTIYTSTSAATACGINGNSTQGSNQPVNAKNHSFTITYAPEGVTSGQSRTDNATFTVTANGQSYTVTVQGTCTVLKPTISINDLSNIYVFETYNLGLTTQNTNGTKHFFSKDESIATVNESTGVVTFLKAQNATLYATQECNGIYTKATSADKTFTPAQVTPVLSWEGTELNRTFKGGDKVYLENYGWSSAEGTDVSKWQGIAIQFISSNISVASVVQESDGRWYVQMNGYGKCDITMRVNIDNANAGNYNSYTPKTHSVEVIKNSQTIVWNDDFSDMRVGGVKTLTAKSMTTDSPARETDLPITYTPNPSGIVTISNGTLTCAKAGYLAVTASQSGNDGYYEAPDETKSFEVDFEAGKTLTCSTAVVMGKSTTVFNLAGDMVKSGNLSLLSCSNTEFDVIFSGYDMNVTFIPTAAGERTADLAFEDDNMTYHLQLSATATAQTITFNSTEIGTSSLSTNSLDISAITLTSLSSNGNIRLVDNGTEHVLPYNGTINGPLTFKYYPTEVETNAEYTLTVNGAYEIIYNVTSTQHTINFADTKVGVATAQQQFEMTNFVAAGTLTAYTSSSEFRINGARYSSSVPLTIINGATLNIDFSPRNTCNFTTAPAQLIISDNGTLYKVNLTGKTEDLEPIDLGTVNIGQASELFEIDDIPAGTVTVTSTSPYVFRVFADDEEATLSTATATANSSIDVSGKGKLYVKFYPETAGEQNETITISIIDSYGETSSYSVRVSGTGVQQTLNISSTMGQLSGTQIALTNMVSAEGYTVSLTTEQEEFRINDDVVASIDVTGGSSLGIKLYPKTSGNKSETVTLLDKSTNRSYTINLTGTVTALTNLNFAQQKVGRTDVSDNKTITLSGWPENKFELDILDGSWTSYANSFLIRGVAGVVSLVNGENETVQFLPKKKFEYTQLTLYAREKSSGILYEIAKVGASSKRNDEVVLEWSDKSDPVMIGMNDCSYGFAYAVGLPELNIYYSVDNGNITTCGDATWGTQSGESSQRNHYSGLQGVNDGTTAIVTAYILASDDYSAQSITRTFQVTDKLSQEIVFQYDAIVLTVGETFSLTGANAAYAIDKVYKDATGANITYTNNGGYISLNGTNFSVNQAGSDGYLDITAAEGTYNEKDYLSATKRVWIIGVQDEICNAEVCKLNDISFNNKNNTVTVEKTTSDFNGKPVGYMGEFSYQLKGYDGIFNKYAASLTIGSNGRTEILNISDKGNSTGIVKQPLSVFSDDITSIKAVGKTENIFITSGSFTVYFSGAPLYQKKYFNKISNDISIDAGEAEQYSSTTTGYIEVANYSALNGIIRYRIVGPDAKSFKVVGTQTTVSNLNKEFTEISCGDLSTAKVKIEFTPQRVGNNYDATLQLIASTTVSGTIAYDTIEIPLSGTGKPRTQEMYWAQGEHLASLKYDDYIAPDADKDIELTAYSSIKGQDVSYAFCDDQGNALETDPTFVSLSGNTLTINGAGDTYIKATQAGKTDGGTVVILPADPVILHIIVAKADPKLKWNTIAKKEIYVYDSVKIFAYSQPLVGIDEHSDGTISYSIAEPTLASYTPEDSLLHANNYGQNAAGKDSISITATISETVNYLGQDTTMQFKIMKVKPALTWGSDGDLTTDMSVTNYTIADGDTAMVDKSDAAMPDVKDWKSGKNVTYTVISGDEVIEKTSDKTFTVKKVGYATIQAQVEAGDNNEASNVEVRNLKVDFDPDSVRDFGTVSTYDSKTINIKLGEEMKQSGKITVSEVSNDNFICGTIQNDTLPITFKPLSHDSENPEQTAVITIHDQGSQQDYHLYVKGTTKLFTPTVTYNATKHSNWVFTTMPNPSVEDIKYSADDDIYCLLPSGILADDEKNANNSITLSLLNPETDAEYVTISDDGKKFTVNHAKTDDDNPFTVYLVATYPGLTGRMEGNELQIPITIQKSLQTISWIETETIDANQESKQINAPTLRITGGDSSIVYSYNPDSVVNIGEQIDNKVTLNLLNKKGTTVAITASIASDKYSKGCTAAPLTITINKVPQFVEWDGNEIINGFDTQRSTEDGIVLNAIAKYTTITTGANIKYNVVEQLNCNGEEDLIRLEEKDNDDLPRQTTLYYTGNGSGTVTIEAIAEATDIYNATKSGTQESPRYTFTISRVDCNVNDWTVNNMRYGDKVVLEPTVDKFTRGENYEYTLPTVTGTLDTAGNVLNVKGVGNGLTISAKKLEDCWVNESEGSTASNTFNIAKSEQEIEWDQNDILAAAIGDAEYQLAVPVAKDKLHTNQNGTWLSTLETGLEVTYDIDQTAATKCSTENVVVIEDGKLKITGRGSGTVTITAKQTSGSEYYNPTNATDEKPIIVNIAKVTPTIEIGGAPTGNVTFGAAPMTITAQAMLNGNVVKDYQDNELYTLANNKIKLTSSDPTTVSVTGNNTLNFLKSGSATITATIEADCIVENKVETTFTVIVDRAAQLLKWESWPADETKSITTCDETFEIALDATTTDVNGNTTGENNVSYEIVSTNGNCNTALVKIEDNKLTYLDAGSGSVEIKAVVAQSDKYSAIDDGESMHRTFVINRCSTDVIVWNGTELNNVHYNDVIVPNADFSELSNKASDKGSISYSVTSGPLNNEFKATDVGTAEITATTGANCYSTGATMAKSFTIQPTTQEIVWEGDELEGLTTGQYANGSKVIELTAKSYDTGAGHNHEETGLDIHYEISVISGESGCENFVMLDPNDNHKLIVTGTGAGTFKITASQKGKDGDGASDKDLCYEAATDVTIDVTISKITPTITFYRSNVNDGEEVYYSDPITYAVSSTGTDYSVSDVSAFTFDVTPVDGGAISENKASHAGNVKIKASQAEDCMINGVESGEVSVEIKKAPQSVSWDVTDLGTLSATSTEGVVLTAVAMNSRRYTPSGMTITYTVCDAQGNEISSGALITISDNKVISAHNGSGVAWVKAVANGDDNYEASQESILKKITITSATPTIAWTDPCSEQMTMNYREEKQLTFSCNYSDYTVSYSLTEQSDDTYVDMTELANGKVKIIGVKPNDGTIGIKVTISDPVGNYGNFELNTTITTQKNNTEIDWNGQSFETYTTADAGTEIELIAFVKDLYKNANSRETVSYGFNGTDVVEGCGNIVELTGDGKLKITGNAAGTVTLYASYAGDENYNASTEKSMQITVGKQTPSFAWTDNADIQATYGDVNLSAGEISKDGDGVVTYSSSEEDVATINSSTGAITLLKQGETIIYADLAATCQYEAGTRISKKLTVGRKGRTLNWRTAPSDMIYGSTQTVVATPSEGEGTITYSINDNTHAAINSSTGEITANGVTSTLITVTATIGATDQYETASVTGTFNITPATAIFVWGDGWSHDVAKEMDYQASETLSVVCQTAGYTNYSVAYTVAEGDEQYASITNDVVTVTEVKSSGNVTVTATISDNNGNYSNVDLTTKIQTNKIVPDGKFIFSDVTLTYNEAGENLDEHISCTEEGMSYDISSYTIYQPDGANYVSLGGSDNKTLSPVNATNGATVTVTAHITGMTNYNDCDVTGNVTVNKGTQTITWDEDKNYTVSNMAGSINLSDYCSGTSGGGTITFSSLDTTVAKVSGNDLIIKKITTGGTVIITATAEGTANYEKATADTVFTITAEEPTISIEQGSSDAPIDLETTSPQVTSVTDGVDFVKLLKDLEAIKCNYDDVTYSLSSLNDDIATFTNGVNIKAFKRSDKLGIQVTASVTGLASVTETLYVKIPRGTMRFTIDGNWNTKANWHRTDMLPSADDHNVSIEANCTIDNTAIAKCFDLEIVNGMLTVNADGVLDVKGTITNTEASKLKLKADASHSATVLFAGGSPDATVENYIQGGLSPEGEGENMKNNPDWQYRGFVGNNPSLSNWNVVIFKWNEALNSTNCWGENPVYEKTGSYSGSPWNGYCMANYDTGNPVRDYTSKLIPSDTIMTYNLSYTNHGQQYPNRGVNLITNSWSAPINMTSADVVFSDNNVERTFYFYKTRNHKDWEDDPENTFEVYPQNTGHVTASSNMIASGQSFLVRATGSNASLTINGGALAHQANGFMYAPAEKERFNVLSITMSNDTMADRLFLLESENCSRAFDNGYDGTKIKEGNMPQIFASNDFGHTAVNTDKTMLGQRIGYSAAEDGALCTITFNTDRLDGFSELYLYDRATKRYADILAGDSYSFTGTKAGEEERFEIVGRRDDGSEFVSSSDMMIEVIGNRALLSGFAGGNDEVFITDMNGKRLWTERASNGPWFELPNLPAGVYLINCGEANCKFIVK